MKNLNSLFDKNGMEILGGGSAVKKGSITIPTAGWVIGLGDWSYKLDLPIVGIDEDMIVQIFYEKDSIDTAIETGISAVDSYNGGVYLYSNKIPVETIFGYYVVVTTGSLQGTQGEIGPQGIQGNDGIQGPVGESSEWVYGTGSPDNGGGNDGWMYLQANGNVWKKIDGEWLYSDINITGLQGEQGIQGIQGIQGSKGDTGEQGPAGVPVAGGTEGALQFNKVGVIDGATRVAIHDDELILKYNSNTTVPPENSVKLFARKIAGRILPAYMGPSGLDSALQPFIARNKIGWFNPAGNSTTVHVLGVVGTGTGTTTAANVATTNIHTAMRRIEYAVTTAAVTAVAGLRQANAQQHIGTAAKPYGGFHFVARFGPSRGLACNATRRFWAGMTSITTAPTDVNPSTWATNGIGVGADSTDANFQIMHKTSTGTMVKVDTGISKKYADNSEMFEIAIFTAPTATSVVVQFTRLSDGAKFIHEITTNLPADTQLLTWQIWTSAGGTSSVIGLSIASVYIETDY